MLAIVISLLTCVSLVILAVFRVKIKIAGRSHEIYYLAPFLGGVLVLIFGLVSIKDVLTAFTEDSSANVLKIVVLFISMTFIAVFIDETGFFEYLACVFVKKAGQSQIKIFICFYLLVSVLTVFTSNDIVILTFTPFICQFAKRAGFNPIPYVVAEFVGANTWSLLFLIGNPTNIYITQFFNVDFFEYLSVMWLPTILAGTFSFITLLLIFRKSLTTPTEKLEKEAHLKDKTLAIIGLTILFICTVLIAISSYIGLEMWIVSASSALILLIVVLVIRLIRKQKPQIVITTLKRVPWQMIPLLIGMFIVVLSLVGQGYPQKIAEVLSFGNDKITYGVCSTLLANLVNNIPMSVLFSQVLNFATSKGAMYATIIGSNIGAFLTPLGALAGLMFTNILHRHDVKFSFLSFVKYGSILSITALIGGLLGLIIVI